MEKNYYCAIEINTIYTSAVVVAFHNNNVHVVATGKVLTSGYGDGRIYDQLLLKKSISTLLEEIKNKFKVTIDEAIIILPNNSHKVYSANVVMSIMTERQIIGLKQIQTARERVRNVTLADNEILVDEVPTLYTLDNNRDMRSMPINLTSSTLSVRSNIHTLPKEIVNDIVDIISSFNIKILDKYINCDCAALAIAKQFDLEDECILIDINQDVTTIAAYSKNFLMRSVKVDFGIKHLVDYLANVLKISFNDALNLFKSYFICDIDLTSDIVFDKENNLNEKRISGIILNRLYSGLDEIISSIESLKENLNFNDMCTFYLSGYLNNFEAFIDVFIKYSKIPVNVNDFNVIGLSDDVYKNCYGAIKKFITNHYDYVKSRYSEDEDEISLSKMDYQHLNKNVINQNHALNNKDESTKTTHSRFKDIFDD